MYSVFCWVQHPNKRCQNNQTTKLLVKLIERHNKPCKGADIHHQWNINLEQVIDSRRLFFNNRQIVVQRINRAEIWVHESFSAFDYDKENDIWFVNERWNCRQDLVQWISFENTILTLKSSFHQYNWFKWTWFLSLTIYVSSANFTFVCMFHRVHHWMALSRNRKNRVLPFYLIESSQTNRERTEKKTFVWPWHYL